VNIRRATAADINVAAMLFDAYRQFYRQASDREGARRFLRDRLERDESVIFLAFDGGTPIGFTQLIRAFLRLRWRRFSS
jgi:hypothetical protein